MPTGGMQVRPNNKKQRGRYYTILKNLNNLLPWQPLKILLLLERALLEARTQRLEVPQNSADNGGRRQMISSPQAHIGFLHMMQFCVESIRCAIAAALDEPAFPLSLRQTRRSKCAAIQLPCCEEQERWMSSSRAFYRSSVSKPNTELVETGGGVRPLWDLE